MKKQHYQENRERLLEQKNQYRLENRDKIIEQKKQHYQEKGAARGGADAVSRFPLLAPEARGGALRTQSGLRY